MEVAGLERLALLEKEGRNRTASLENRLNELCNAEQTLRALSLEGQLEAISLKDEAGREMIKSLQNELEKLLERMQQDRQCMAIGGITAFIIIVLHDFQLANNNVNGKCSGWHLKVSSYS